MLSMDMMELMSGFDRDCKTAGNIADLETVIVQAFQSLCVKTLSYFHHPPFNEIDGGPVSLYFISASRMPGWKNITHPHFQEMIRLLNM